MARNGQESQSQSWKFYNFTFSNQILLVKTDRKSTVKKKLQKQSVASAKLKHKQCKKLNQTCEKFAKIKQDL